LVHVASPQHGRKNGTRRRGRAHRG
jgi:hypothetical protein